MRGSPICKQWEKTEGSELTTHVDKEPNNGKEEKVYFRGIPGKRELVGNVEEC